MYPTVSQAQQPVGEMKPHEEMSWLMPSTCWHGLQHPPIYHQRCLWELLRVSQVPERPSLQLPIPPRKVNFKALKATKTKNCPNDLSPLRLSHPSGHNHSWRLGMPLTHQTAQASRDVQASGQAPGHIATRGVGEQHQALGTGLSHSHRIHMAVSEMGIVLLLVYQLVVGGGKATWWTFVILAA